MLGWFQNKTNTIATPVQQVAIYITITKECVQCIYMLTKVFQTKDTKGLPTSVLLNFVPVVIPSRKCSIKKVYSSYMVWDRQCQKHNTLL